MTGPEQVQVVVEAARSTPWDAIAAVAAATAAVGALVRLFARLH